MVTTIDAPARSRRRIHLDQPAVASRHRSPIRRLVTIPGVDTPLFWWLLVVVAVVNIIGLVMVLSASSVASLSETGSPWSYFTKQLLWTGVGIAVAFTVLHVRIERLRPFGLPALGLCLLGLLAVHVPGLGVSANGATRWVGIGPIQIQPSELTKLALIVVLADWLDRKEAYLSVSRVVIRPMMLLLGVVAGLVMFAQHDMGTMIIIALTVFSVLFAAGVPRRALGLWGLAAAATGVAATVGTAYRRARFKSLLNPWADPTHSGYQLIQSRVGLASGGIFGDGLGASRAKWGFLPFAHTDFIFAIVGEELGLVGAVVVIGAFLTFGILGVMVASRSETRFGASVAVGVTVWIVAQAFV
ncbi:MAG: cell division protein FtsW, partial [Actinobacteria bacterium]|nr:cell division protein FtsW [Actinomycetota bacterium]